MRNDDQLAEEIGARLHAELADVRPAPGLAATVRRRHVRQTVAGYTATLGTLGVAAVLVVALAGEPGAGPAAGPTTAAPTGTVQLESVAYVTGKADEALADLGKYVLASTAQMPTGIRFERLADPTTGRQRSTAFTKDGFPATDICESGRPSTRPTVLVVSHRDRAWWTYKLVPPPGVANVDREDLTDPAEIRAALTAGSMEILGHEQVDGVDTLHLRLVVTSKPQSLGTVELWVDAGTYLPRRVVSGKSQSADRVTTTTFTWLPRNDANLAKLDLTPPADYRHLPKAPEPTSSQGVG